MTAKYKGLVKISHFTGKNSQKLKHLLCALLQAASGEQDVDLRTECHFHVEQHI